MKMRSISWPSSMTTLGVAGAAGGATGELIASFSCAGWRRRLQSDFLVGAVAFAGIDGVVGSSGLRRASCTICARYFATLRLHAYLFASRHKTAVRSFMVSRSSWPPRAPLRRRPRHSGRTMDPASGCRLLRPPVVACRIRTRARKQRGHEWHSRGGFALDALRCVGDGPYRCQMAFGDVEVPLAPSSDQYTHPHYLPHHHHPHHTTHTVCARRDDPFARARRSLAATSRSAGRPSTRPSRRRGCRTRRSCCACSAAVQ